MSGTPSCTSNSTSALPLPTELVEWLLKGAPGVCSVAPQWITQQQSDIESALSDGELSAQKWCACFWAWVWEADGLEDRPVAAPQADAAAGHALDGLPVLPLAGGDGARGLALLAPLRQRRRCLVVEGSASAALKEARAALKAAGVLLLGEQAQKLGLASRGVVPSGSQGAVSAAAAAAEQDAVAGVELGTTEAHSWRALLSVIAKHQELSGVPALSRRLPLFKQWKRQQLVALGDGAWRLFPLPGRPGEATLHCLLQGQSVGDCVLDERDPQVVDLLKLCRVTEMSEAAAVRAQLSQVGSWDAAARDRLMEYVLRHNEVMAELDSELRTLRFVQVRDASLGLLSPCECLLPSKGDAERFGDVPLKRVVVGDLAECSAELERLGARSRMTLPEAAEVAVHLAKHKQGKAPTRLAEELLRWLGSTLDDSEGWSKVPPALRREAWLPPERRPPAWLGPWHGDSAGLCSPEQTWDPDCTLLVGRTAAVAPTSAGPELRRLLGVREEGAVGDSELHQQLQALREAWEAAEAKKRGEQPYAAALRPIYERMHTLPPGMAWAPEEGFVRIERLCRDGRAAQLYPVLLPLPDDWRDFDVFKEVQKLDEPCLRGVLMRLPPERLDPREQKIAIAALEFAVDLGICEQPEKGAEWLLLTEGRELRSASQVFVRDMGTWFTPQERAVLPAMHPAHERLPLRAAKRLGARRLSDLVEGRCGGAEQDWDLSELGEAIGQCEPLLQRLSTLVEGYPTECIVKEMLQNADDAGATEFRVIIDWRQGRKESVFKEDAKDWQGPALLFYNNAVFTDKDWKGITCLGKGSKSDDSSSTGRFGLGFNSCYGITDFPSIVSGDYVQFFDPHCRNHGKATPDRPGYRYNMRQGKKPPHQIWVDQFEVYKGVCGCDLNKTYKGTLFRFPLRHPKAGRSEIRDECFGEHEWKALRHLIERDLHTWLIFLPHVATAEVHEIPARASSPASAKRLMRCDRKVDKHGRVHMIRKPQKEVSYRCGSRGEGAQRVDVAIGRSERGRIFCRLPLTSCYTGGDRYQVHLNALFHCTQDRRQLLLSEGLTEGEHMSKTRHNERLLESAVLTLCEMLEGIVREGGDPSPDYPPAKGGSDHGKRIAEVFYPRVLDEKRHVFRSVSGRPLQQWPMLWAAEAEQAELRKALAAVNAPVAVVTREVAEGFVDVAGCEAQVLLSPARLRQWLQRLPNDTFPPGQSVVPLLRYCTSDGKEDELQGCPLLLTADGSVERFGERCVVAIAQGNKAEVQLFSHLPSRQLMDRRVPAELAGKLLGCPQLKVIRLTPKWFADMELHPDASWLPAFWSWYLGSAARCEDVWPGGGAHVLDKLRVLPVVGSKNAIEFRDRVRTVCDPPGGVREALTQCGVYVLNAKGLLPRAHRIAWQGVPDDLVRAVHHALSDRVNGVSADLTPMSADPWLALRDEMARSSRPELSALCKQLPLFRKWALSSEPPALTAVAAPAKWKIFPPGCAKLRELLQAFPVTGVILEDDTGVLRLLQDVGVATWSVADVIKSQLKALTCTDQVPRQARHDLLHWALLDPAVLLDLQHVLREQPFVDTAKGLLKPRECLSPFCSDAQEFPSARLCLVDPTTKLAERKFVVMLEENLGCRRKLTPEEAGELAGAAAAEKDTDLARRLFWWLERQGRAVNAWQESATLRDAAWLPAAPMPADWLGPWGGAQAPLVRPRECWADDCRKWVGRLSPIAPPATAALLEWLGVRGAHSELSSERLHQELESLRAAWGGVQEGRGEPQLHIWRRALTPIYEKMKHPPQGGAWVWDGRSGGFHEVHTVCTRWTSWFDGARVFDLQPALIPLCPEWMSYKVFQQCPTLDADCLRRALQRVNAGAAGKPIPPPARKSVIAMVLLAARMEAGGDAGAQKESAPWLVLAQDHTIRSADRTFDNDMAWYRGPVPEGYSQAHDDIAFTVLRVGAKPLSEVFLRAMRTECSGSYSAPATDKPSAATLPYLATRVAARLGAERVVIAYDRGTLHDLPEFGTPLTHRSQQDFLGPCFWVLLDAGLSREQADKVVPWNCELFAHLLHHTASITMHSAGKAYIITARRREAGAVSPPLVDAHMEVLDGSQFDLTKLWPVQFPFADVRGRMAEQMGGARGGTLLRIPLPVADAALRTHDHERQVEMALGFGSTAVTTISRLLLFPTKLRSINVVTPQCKWKAQCSISSWGDDLPRTVELHLSDGDRANDTTETWTVASAAIDGAVAAVAFPPPRGVPPRINWYRLGQASTQCAVPDGLVWFDAEGQSSAALGQCVSRALVHLICAGEADGLTERYIPQKHTELLDRRAFLSQLFTRFKLFGWSLSDVKQISPPNWLSKGCLDWLAKSTGLVNLPRNLQAVIGADSEFSVPAPAVAEVVNTLRDKTGGVSASHARELLLWMAKETGVSDEQLHRLPLLPLKSGGLGTPSGVWLAPPALAGIMAASSVHAQVPWSMEWQRLYKRLALRSPLCAEDIAARPDMINHAEFWDAFATVPLYRTREDLLQHAMRMGPLGFRLDDKDLKVAPEEIMEVHHSLWALVGKLDVRVSGQRTSTVRLGEHCCVSRSCPAAAQLERVGCLMAVDKPPSPYSALSREQVLHHMQRELDERRAAWYSLSRKHGWPVDKEVEYFFNWPREREHAKRLVGFFFPAGTVDQGMCIHLILQMPIVETPGGIVPLSDVMFTSPEAAELVGGNCLPHDVAPFVHWDKVLAAHRLRYTDLEAVRKCADRIRRSTVDTISAVIHLIAKADPDGPEQAAELPIVKPAASARTEPRCLKDLWDARDPIVRRLLKQQHDMLSTTYLGKDNMNLQRFCIKTSECKPEQLLDLLREGRPEACCPAGEEEKLTADIISALNQHAAAPGAGSLFAGLECLPFVWVNGWHKPAQVYARDAVPLVSLSQVPFVREVRFQHAFKGAEEVPPELAVQQLAALSRKHKPGTMSFHMAKHAFLPVYSFLNQQCVMGNKKIVSELKDMEVGCVLTEDGMKYAHAFVVDLQNELPNCLAPLPDELRQFSCLMTALGAKEFGSKVRVGPKERDLLKVLSEQPSAGTLFIEPAFGFGNRVEVHIVVWMFHFPASKPHVQEDADSGTKKLVLPCSERTVNFLKVFAYSCSAKTLSEGQHGPAVAGEIWALERVHNMLGCGHLEDCAGQVAQGIEIREDGEMVVDGLPGDWTHRGHGHVLVPVPDKIAEMQGLMNAANCCRHQFTVHSVTRVENPALFRAQRAMTAHMRSQLRDHCASPLGHHMAPHDGQSERAGLSADMNEFYLFHATKWQWKDQIVGAGFDERVASTGGMYGAGNYFAVKACKADGYAGTNAAGRRLMLYCRVVLGEPYVTTSRSLPGIRRPPECGQEGGPKRKGSPYDSVVATSGADGTHAEFIVYRGLQAYPELLIEYSH
eukprot:TRINITY_DN7988_c0_g1_i4.p1 TRINITY_DN7988_c0_g1~~TRINITY_DN7988_c0_g1_i4.p1  ORF type:complete len:3393 (+),score=795.00 TRINITY_DN7988_c0_g1_i4:5118-15296(+)